MRKSVKWLLVGVFGFVVLLVVALAGLSRWAGSDDFRTMAQQRASTALGVPVQLGRIELTLWPKPGVALRDVHIATRPALTLEQLDARPMWLSLLVGRPVLDALVLRNAVLPQGGLLALVANLQKGAAKSPSATPPPLPRRILLEKVSWIDTAGQKLTVDAEVAFEHGPLPELARFDVVAGRYAGAKAVLERQAEAWQLRAEIGGGTITGPLRLQPQKGGGWRLSGDIVTDKVEVSALTAPSRTMTGRVEARTSLQADFREASELADMLRSQTRFTVRHAVLHGIDLAQAVRTLGISRGGQTALDTLTGSVVTQGKVVHLNNLVASSGLLSATGNVTLAADRTLDGKVTAALGGALGVPLKVAGTLDAPSVSPTGVALPAAADLGSRIGGGIKGLFGK
ncbi:MULTISPECIES: AsmA family protein [Ramlibacter]|uniref:AsmA family protein n=1 Tax=Ramlibacter pinisoli TaxID=2682844 RepID=A0A6N8INW2_9BURK|nr:MULTISPECIES: AsmA family protein [Ramlibacter]MBA2960585.1 hypothetical protein [Ramlibacter sp. CGMCC 1.13660]MVQ27916.1 hypothetical protein [Ramlibacter pinisoli]